MSDSVTGDPRELIAQGDFLSRQRNWSAAAEVYQRAVEASAADLRMLALGGLGRMRQEQGLFVEAESIFREVLDHGSTAEILDATERLGSLMLTQGRLADATNFYKQVVASGHPAYAPRGMFGLAQILVRQGHSHEAEELLSKVIGLGEKYSAGQAAAELGALLFRQERWLEAEDAFRVASERVPPFRAEWAKALVGSCLVKRGALSAAEQLFHEILDSGPDLRLDVRLGAAVSLGTLLLNDERYEEAEAVLPAQLEFLQGRLPESWLGYLRTLIAAIFSQLDRDPAEIEALWRQVMASPYDSAPIVDLDPYAAGVVDVADHAHLDLVRLLIATERLEEADAELAIVLSSARDAYVRTEAERLLAERSTW
jgi:tetratricopeptide (TPR) repeat protein